MYLWGPWSDIQSGLYAQRELLWVGTFLVNLELKFPLRLFNAEVGVSNILKKQNMDILVLLCKAM